MYPTMWNENMEAISPEDQSRLEQDLLIRQVQYVYANSTMYQRRIAEKNLTSDDIKGVEDLERLPFTTKAELRRSREIEPPPGDFLAADRDQVVRVHRTSGSTGSLSTPP